MDGEAEVRVLPSIQEQTARVLAAVMLMEPGIERLNREWDRLKTRFGETAAAAVWKRAQELKSERGS